MKHFGPTLLSPPVGEICQWCEEPIAEGDRGVFYNDFENQPWHEECITRFTVGSVGHILGICYCHNGTYEDPPGLTRRQSAKAAYLFWVGSMFGRGELNKEFFENERFSGQELGT